MANNPYADANSSNPDGTAIGAHLVNGQLIDNGDGHVLTPDERQQRLTALKSGDAVLAPPASGKAGDPPQFVAKTDLPAYMKQQGQNAANYGVQSWQKNPALVALGGGVLGLGALGAAGVGPLAAGSGFGGDAPTGGTSPTGSPTPGSSPVGNTPASPAGSSPGLLQQFTNLLSSPAAKTALGVAEGVNAAELGKKATDFANTAATDANNAYAQNAPLRTQGLQALQGAIGRNPFSGAATPATGQPSATAGASTGLSPLGAAPTTPPGLPKPSGLQPMVMPQKAPATTSTPGGY